MNFEVIYYTKTKNTKKIAEVIAQELDVSAENVKEKNKISKDSIVLLGSGLYANRLGKDIVNFIESNDFKGIKVAVFGTSGEGMGKETQILKDMLEKRGAIVIDEFHCKGKAMYLFQRSHPTNEEFERAREFARKLR